MKEIFNIFKKKKKREGPIEKPKIIADYREKNSLVISELINLGIDIETKELKVADYLIAGTAVERKTVSDFINSMKNGRLVNQLEELRQYESRLLVVEGVDEQELYSDDSSEDNIGMHPNSIRGFLLSILLNYKVPIIFTKNYEDTAKFLAVLCKKKPREISLNIKKRAHNQKEQSQYVLESFPGIGPKTARKLLKKFRAIKDMINAPEEDIKKVIGKKAENLIRIINYKY